MPKLAKQQNVNETLCIYDMTLIGREMSHLKWSSLLGKNIESSLIILLVLILSFNKVIIHFGKFSL